MKTTFEKLYLLANHPSKILLRLYTTPMPKDIKGPWLVRRVMAIKTAIDTAIGETSPFVVAFNALYKQHGDELPSQKDTYKIRPDEMEQFKAALDVLMKDEIELDVNQLTIEDLAILAMEPAPNAMEIELLMPFLKEPTAESQTPTP